MYAKKPLQENLNVQSNVSMYTVKSYYGECPIVSCETASDESLDSLAKRCGVQYRRLLKLEKKIGDLCDELNLTNLLANDASSSSKQSTTKCQSVNTNLTANVRKEVKKSTNKFEDIVFQVDPRHVPYSLFLAYEQLAAHAKCFVTFHTHGTCLTPNSEIDLAKIQRFKEFYAQWQATEPRHCYDYAMTVVWKKMSSATGPVMSLANGGKIYGESNLLRYLHSLLPVKGQAKVDIAMDEWMDKCTNFLSFTSDSAKPNLNSYLSLLNVHLGKNQLVHTLNNQPSMADYYTWSSLVQSAKTVNASFKNVNEWLTKMEANYSLMQLIKSI